MLKKIINTVFIILFLYGINYVQINKHIYNLKTNNIIKNKKNLDYITINNTKLIIKSGNEKEILDSNYVYIMNNSNIHNIFLAGHNSYLVFNRIYSLRNGDKVYLKYKGKKYIYSVNYSKYVMVDDNIYKKSNKNKLTLITCTNNTQKRYIVVCHIISHI